MEWLSETLRSLDKPIDVVAHEIGALLTMRIASASDVPLRSWAVDVAAIFHPDFEWPERVHDLQTPGRGEEMLKTMREANPDDPQSTASRPMKAGVPRDLARAMGNAHVLDFYRSAVPNVSAGWWEDVSGPTRSSGLDRIGLAGAQVLPDPHSCGPVVYPESHSLRGEGGVGAALSIMAA